MLILSTANTYKDGSQVDVEMVAQNLLQDCDLILAKDSPIRDLGPVLGTVVVAQPSSLCHNGGDHVPLEDSRVLSQVFGA
jgi:ABC-type phosphate/phosphonate transport system ATPase subunit